MPTCPREGCGGTLRRVRFVDMWTLKGRPVDPTRDLYCAKCKTRWTGEKVDDIAERNRVPSVLSKLADVERCRSSP